MILIHLFLIMKINFRQTLGQEGEERAKKFFQEKGFLVVTSNFRFKRIGEIDLIVFKKGLLIFVEVKTRKTVKYGGGLYSLNRKKIRTIKRVAENFLFLNPNFYHSKITCRFDLINIKADQIEWRQDCFR